LVRVTPRAAQGALEIAESQRQLSSENISDCEYLCYKIDNGCRLECSNCFRPAATYIDQALNSTLSYTAFSYLLQKKVGRRA